MSSISSDTPFDLTQNPRFPTEDAAIELLEDDTEQEVKLHAIMQLLRQSLEDHIPQIMVDILYSKIGMALVQK